MRSLFNSIHYFKLVCLFSWCSVSFYFFEHPRNNNSIRFINGKYLFPSVGYCFVQMMVFMVVHKFFSIIMSHLLIIVLVSVLLVFYSERSFLVQWVQENSPLSFFTRIKICGLMLKTLIHLSWVLCRLTESDQFSFFYM